MRFWDTSALLALLVDEPAREALLGLLEEDGREGFTVSVPDACRPYGDGTRPPPARTVTTVSYNYPRPTPPIRSRRSPMSRASLTVPLTLTLYGCVSPHHDAGLQTIAVEGAPKAIGPYAQAIVADGFLYAAGQTPRDPATGNPVAGDIAAQTNRVLDNLEAVLKGGGCTLQDVVKVTVYMTDLADFAGMNEVFAARFGSHRPARSTVQVAKLPGGAQIEMDAIARVPH